jgi:hypothetical protein
MTEHRNWNEVPSGSNFIKWEHIGQEEKGTMAALKEGNFGFEVHFTDGRIMGLSLSDLRAKVKDAEPEVGDQIYAKWVAEKPTSQPAPMKIFEVRVTRREGSPPAPTELV